VFKKLAATGILGFAVAGSVLAAAPAYAGGWDHGHGHGHGNFSGNHTSGNGSILGGTQVIAPISIPIDVCGNAVAVIGIAGAGCKGGASVSH
jgi:hypothetical protein